MVFGPFRDTFFSTSQKKCLTGYFCVTFRADHFPQILFFIAPTWGRFWPILVFSIFLIFHTFLCVFCVFFVCMWPFLGEVFRSITCFFFANPDLVPWGARKKKSSNIAIVMREPPRALSHYYSSARASSSALALL